jgi:hypothetical protein
VLPSGKAIIRVPASPLFGILHHLPKTKLREIFCGFWRTSPPMNALLRVVL